MCIKQKYQRVIKQQKKEISHLKTSQTKYLTIPALQKANSNTEMLKLLQNLLKLKAERVSKGK